MVDPVQARDFRGASVTWRWHGYERHLKKRPEIADWHAAIGKTLSEPEVVAEFGDRAWGYYRRSVLPRKYGDLYLLVVVRWIGAQGEIATAFPTDRIKPFEHLVQVRK
jgi:hypothetical protein